MAVVTTDQVEDDQLKECILIKENISSTVDGRIWSKSEKKQWVVGLFAGTTFLYAARTIMPLCVVGVAEELHWDKTESGMVLSAFFWGYCMTQFLGGYLSDRVGGDVVLPIAACMWSLITFWTPQFAYLSTDKHIGLYIVVLSRVLLGAFQGFHYPGMTSIISRKVLENQRSFTYSVVAAGSYVGTLLTGSLGSVIMDEYGWQMSFYCIGLLGITWMLMMRYMLIGKNRRKHLSISPYSEPLIEKVGKGEPKSSVPWLNLFAKPAFWSLLVGHFCENNAFYILLSWMPTYFHENFPSAKGWVFNVVPWFITIPSSVGSGYLADIMINKGYSVTFVRKLMESVALLGTAFFLFLISFASSYHMCLTCLALAVACCGFHSSGILVNPQDIAPRHAGSVFGIMNMAGAIPGFIGVYIAGHILETTKSWNAVFGQTAVVCLFGWVVYLIFGTGKKVI
ncbi:solute carrier family 17 member 9 [Plakobranchus ocellatus]|uniref:Solute carrier family 17 member 9 n=1 Tax=Plakobranchus ocellatus TaxID=259542 RepID=A0AAV4BWU8_9GAST|nr:solute carrier family 17 member 9 [Plakobranchus ocellatus]